MKTPVLIAALALAFVFAAGAAEPAPAPTAADALRDVQALSDRLEEAQNQIADLQKRLETVEQRLGETYTPFSPFDDTVEKRLEDLEDDVEDLKRR